MGKGGGSSLAVFEALKLYLSNKILNEEIPI
jgi:hypothetical protein